MILSRFLLLQFVDISHIDMEKACIVLSSIGLEVESAYALKLPQNVVVGKILSCKPHPDADKLRVCNVDIGTQQLQIVCGAANVSEGQYVAVALEGAVIPNVKGGSLSIKKTTLRGVDSFGMICSSTELGLPKLNDGIMVLDKTVGSLSLGAEVGSLELFDDYVIDVNITPNRGDCLSVLGIARELASYYDLKLKQEIDTDGISTLGLGRVLQVSTDEMVEASLLYRVVEIKQANLPLDIALSLARNGNLSDDIVCNILEYSTYMTGVILNAYKLYDCEDKNKIGDDFMAHLHIRQDENGFEAVFANEKLSVVGVTYGERHFGTRSEILIIEANYVQPDTIAKAIHSNNIKGDTQLTYRSTRGSNPNLEVGMDFLCRKLVQTSEALVYSGSHSICQTNKNNSIKVRFSAINSCIGVNLSQDYIATTLRRLNFELLSTYDEEFFMVTVPSYRHDLSDVQDIAEEILRIHGIDKIPSEPLLCLQTHNISDTYFAYRNARRLAYQFISNSFTECIHYIFASSQKLENLGFAQLDDNLSLLNPITNELDTLRTSLLPALLDSINRNKNLGFKSIALFEIGSAYTSNREEKQKLAFVASGLMKDESYPRNQAIMWDFFSFASVCHRCVGCVRLQNIRDCSDANEMLANFGFNDDRILHPYQSAFVYLHDKPVGVIAKLHPQIAMDLDLDETFICEIELEMDKVELSLAKEFSKYQKSVRDLTILIDKDISFYLVREAITKANIEYIENLYPVDVYYDDTLGKQMALSIRVVLQSYSATLQEAQIANAMQSILDTLTNNFGATLRT